jgi:hypothetical protein
MEFSKLDLVIPLQYWALMESIIYNTIVCSNNFELKCQPLCIPLAVITYVRTLRLLLGTSADGQLISFYMLTNQNSAKDVINRVYCIAKARQNSSRATWIPSYSFMGSCSGVIQRCRRWNGSPQPELASAPSDISTNKSQPIQHSLSFLLTIFHPNLLYCLSINNYVETLYRFIGRIRSSLLYRYL